LSGFYVSDEVYSLDESCVLDGVYVLDEICILSEVGGFCGLGMFGLGIVWFLDEVYVLGGLYNLDVACSLDGECVLGENYILDEDGILGGAVIVFALSGYVVVGGYYVSYMIG
jgi:hypothetical protein